jgi:hypothetical protein
MVSHFFKCGHVIVARRALDAGNISHAMYEEIVREAIQLYKESKQTKKPGGGDYYNTKGSRIDKRFFMFVLDSVSRGKTLYSEAFRLTDTNRQTFPKLMERMNA